MKSIEYQKGFIAGAKANGKIWKREMLKLIKRKSEARNNVV